MIFSDFPVLVDDSFDIYPLPARFNGEKGGVIKNRTYQGGRDGGVVPVPSKLVSRRPEVFEFFGQGTLPSVFKGAYPHEREENKKCRA